MVIGIELWLWHGIELWLWHGIELCYICQVCSSTSVRNYLIYAAVPTVRVVFSVMVIYIVDVCVIYKPCNWQSSAVDFSK